MFELIIASLVWGFSFGLIGRRLAGLDPALVAAIRLGLSLLLFIPWGVRRRPPAASTALLLLLCGATQFGLMYLCLFAAFAYLPSHLVALFTIFTPLAVALGGGLGRPRRLPRLLLAALLAVAGAAAVSPAWQESAHFWRGFLLMQASNLSFALGQLGYRRLMARSQAAEIGDAGAMAWLFAGGVMAVLPPALTAWQGGAAMPTPPQWLVLAYLGLIASGLAFWLWNRGARRVEVATLAVMNNLKIPLAVAISLFIFGERANPWPLAGAALLMALALLVARGGREGISDF